MKIGNQEGWTWKGDGTVVTPVKGGDLVIPAKVICNQIGLNVWINLHGIWTANKLVKYNTTISALFGGYAQIYEGFEGKLSRKTISAYKKRVTDWVKQVKSAVDKYGLPSLPTELRQGWRWAEELLELPFSLSENELVNPNMA